MTRAFIFPGQGSQYIGMGKDLAEEFPAARDTFAAIDEALGEKLSALIFEGDEAILNLTENTQPALMAVSLAVVNSLKGEGMRFEESCGFVAGHSLGEYSALAASGAIELAQTARLLKKRGQAMQKAVPVGEGTMAAILGLEMEDIQQITHQANQTAVCEIANDNSNGQIVISGKVEGIEKAIQLATDKGAKRAIMLPVSAPFHCSLMAPAAQVMSYALADTDIRPPCVPVVANITARAESEPADIRRLLVDQITGRVRWRESVLWMAENGVTEMVELGAGKILSGLVKRISGDVATQSIGSVDQIHAFLKAHHAAAAA